jgi:hypothetical protein
MSASQHDPQNSSSGSTWLTVALVVLVLIVLACGGLCAGCIYVGRQAANQAGKAFEQIAESLPLMQAMVAAQLAVTSDPQVIDRLGEPVTLTSSPARQGAGKLKPAGETFQFVLTGPKGKGIASAVATSSGAEYRVVKITVTFEDGSVVEVQPPEDQSGFGNLPPPTEETGTIPIDPELNAPIEAK